MLAQWDYIKMAVTKRKSTGIRLRFLILKRDNYRCQLCGNTAANGARLEVDHKLAVAVGGLDDPSNLWTLCFNCNRGKYTHFLKEPPPKPRSNEKMSLSDWLLTRRLQASELAEKVGVDRATISRIINGRQSTKMKTARLISEALNVDLDQVTEFEVLLQPKKFEAVAA